MSVVFQICDNDVFLPVGQGKIKQNLENTAVVLRILDGGQETNSHLAATPTTLDGPVSITYPSCVFSLVN